MMTPPGTNARQSQVDQGNRTSGFSFELLNSLMPLLREEMRLKGETIPTRESIIKSLQALRSQQNIDMNAGKTRAAVTSNANKAGRAATAATGGNSGAATAAKVAAINQGTTAANQGIANAYDPMQQAKLDSMVLDGITQASQVDYGGLSALTGNIYGAPQQPVGQGLGEVLGMVAGQYVASQTGHPPVRQGGGGGSGGTTNGDGASGGGSQVWWG